VVCEVIPWDISYLNNRIKADQQSAFIFIALPRKASFQIMMKPLREFLKRSGSYEYIRYSFFFRLYARLFKRQVIQDHEKEVAFYKTFLPGHCPLIFDIGAYDGHKTAAFLELAGKVVSCEPDKHNFRTLRIRFRNNRSAVMLENKAVSDHVGTDTYYIHHAGSAFNTLNPKWKQLLEADQEKRWNETIRFSEAVTITLTTLDELIHKYGRPYFIKIDVEGYELTVLKGLSQKVPYLSFECLLPDCKTELLDCLAHLYQLDNKVVFNAAFEERLEFVHFLSYHDMINWVSNEAAPRCFEIVSKMNL
jgi:FkbM family methyltransferase